MYILDTVTISELRKARMLRGDAHLAAWAAGIRDEDMFLSAMTIQELEFGVLRAERKDTLKGRILRKWMTEYVIAEFRNRIISVDAAVAQRSAQLNAARTRSFADGLIAATAYIYNFSVVTRNVRHFENTGVNIINPWLE